MRENKLKKAQSQKKQRYFLLIATPVVTFIISVLSSMHPPVSNDELYIHQARWSKAIASTAGLKLAINECLSDNDGNATRCNGFISKLENYSATLPSVRINNEIQSVFVMENAGIKIVGSTALGGCVLTTVPSVQGTKQTITWEITMQSQKEDADSLKKCQTYIKNSH